MASIVDNIISLENEADDIIEKARAGAKDLARSVDDEIVRYREKLTGELEIRLVQFGEEVKKKFESTISDASEEHARRLRKVKDLPESFTTIQLERILDRFNNW